ncbi:hypothetical protein PPERSA_01182 [Pseudocohnilembus persalinus]|uniref:Uncharacterized protein n=1 Tax=Pseudocohnilembus persalinus TaxID=266149 RepID=A0A0V0R161_PSEPJ|nr:hypothetical protein PPERSA_01182 [Pseudocohnilembus persalinus]|eukprot:KRX08252.1 hypothetical protein PPERSA_01182 [Pseudocohnilembus persalinus]
MSKQTQEFYSRDFPPRVSNVHSLRALNKYEQSQNNYFAPRSAKNSETNQRYSHFSGFQPHSTKMTYRGSQKFEKSVHDFHKTQVDSCSHIKRVGLDGYKAVPFYQKHQKRKNPSIETKSMTQIHFAAPRYQSIASGDKKLVPYGPHSQRNRFIEKTFEQKYYNNKSDIELGQRTSYQEKQDAYNSTYRTSYIGAQLRNNLNNSNQGISAYWNTWKNRHNKY